MEINTNYLTLNYVIQEFSHFQKTILSFLKGCQNLKKYNLQSLNFKFEYINNQYKQNFNCSNSNKLKMFNVFYFLYKINNVKHNLKINIFVKSVK